MNLSLADYRIADADLANIMTPALAIYPKFVEHNIQVTLAECGNDPNRWRPHIKTNKLPSTMRRFMQHGVKQFKAATTLELLTLCQIGAPDANLAYSLVGANARRTCDIAAQFPNTRVSATIEHPSQLKAWVGSKVALYVDVNPGMNRSGLPQARVGDIVALTQAIIAAGVEFAGIHYYDGHLSHLAMPERTVAAHQNYDGLMTLIAAINGVGIRVPEVVTSGTPAYPCALTYAPFRGANFVHRVSPGTVIYADMSFPNILPQLDYKPAAVVIAHVASHPAPNRVTAYAGHKALSADAGIPTGEVIGHADWSPKGPSEEHLPIDVPAGSILPDIGEVLYFVPRHVCPTVNNFDHALIIEEGRVVAVEDIAARGRETPVWGNLKLKM